jgi:protein-tyrosine phosphatase
MTNLVIIAVAQQFLPIRFSLIQAFRTNPEGIPMQPHDPKTTPTVLESAANFRSLCGYLTVDNRRVREGKLYRSEALVNLTEGDMVLLSGLGIRRVHDLRSPEERQRDPNRWVEGSDIDLISLDAGQDMGVVKAAGWRERIMEPDFDATQARQWMLAAYTRMPRAYAESLAVGFASFTSPESPALLVHCAAGKDRTGFFCAMFLWALGVPWETIVEDYLLSSERQPPAQLAQRILQRSGENYSSQAVDVLTVIAGVDIEFLNTAFDVTRREYGSIDAYLEQACGLDAQRRKRLQDCLLTG